MDNKRMVNTAVFEISAGENKEGRPN